MEEKETTFVERRAGDTWVNALIGALVAIVLSFTVVGGVVATLAGGFVAGFLQGESRGAGTKVGAIAGAIATVPVLVIVAIVMSVVGIGVLSSGADGGFGLGIATFFVVIMVAFALLINVGLSALGGFLGTAFAEGRDRDGRDRDATTGWSDVEDATTGDVDRST